jgi:hypothetical protein
MLGVIRLDTLDAQLKAFFCALVDSDITDPLVLVVLSERNRRLMEEAGNIETVRPGRVQ